MLPSLRLSLRSHVTLSASQQLTRAVRSASLSVAALRRYSSGSSPQKIEAALESFRKRASGALSEVASAKSGSTAHLDAVLRDAVDAEVAATESAADGKAVESGEADAALSTRLCDEARETVKAFAEIDDMRQERKYLKSRRADLLAVGFQTHSSENAEFGSLVVCAAAGIFAVSLHYAFFSLFGVAYLVYRKATSQRRMQREATDELDHIVDRLYELDELEAAKWVSFQARADAWQVGQALKAEPE
eukprot:TRINITY_DN39584_c0_g1_i1.p1 TRINITY_DN39584_c0_g1~~TRINITY_DN39584_c0_g1_i1.p1  ORF type:complete len:247 (-),score=57.79 TRINITY_DN39584_c0_g1_i1:93-833(-)